MKSKPYALNGKTFRYDFDRCVVEHIYKADEETIQSEADWKARHDGRSLYGIDEDGYIVCNTVGLSKKNWIDKETRDEYLAGWVDELEEEADALIADFVKNELPHMAGGDAR